MAAKLSTITVQVTCPMHAHEGARFSCNGELVTATLKGATAKVAPCSSLVTQGWDGAQYVGTRTSIDRWLPVQTVVRHRDGLVWIGA